MAKYCMNCGSKMEDDDLVCGECGTPFPKLATEHSSESAVSKIKSFKLSNLPMRYLKIGTAFLVVLIVAIILFATHKTTINLNNYINISFEGCNGYGRATATFDSEAFRERYSDKIKFVESDSSVDTVIGYLTAAEALEISCVSGNLDVSSNLTNGDEVTYIWKCDDTLAETVYGVKLKYNDITATVENLKEAETVDLFENISLSCSGVDGYGTIDVVSNGTAEYLNNVSFVLGQTNNISNGDTVSVLASIGIAGSEMDAYFANNYGVIPESYEKAFTVSGLATPEEFDPFEYVDISFSGIAPNGKASVSVDTTLECMQEIIASLSQQTDLVNGDQVVVSLELSAWHFDSDVNAYWAKNYGLCASSLTRTYNVAGLPYYISSLSDIPNQTIDSLKSQTEDVIAATIASSWTYPESFAGMNYLGAYLLTVKPDIFYPDFENTLTLVYSINADSFTKMDGSQTEAFTYYYYVTFYDLTMQADGICAPGKTRYSTPSNMFNRDWLNYSGYLSLDALFSDCVTRNVDKYTYESSVASSVLNSLG